MKNKVADIIKIYAIVNAVCGLFVGCYVGYESYSFVIGFIIVVAVAIASFILYAFGEVIQLLHDIKMNTLGTKEIVGSSTGKAFDSTSLPKL